MFSDAPSRVECGQCYSPGDPSGGPERPLRVKHRIPNMPLICLERCAGKPSERGTK